MQTFNTIVAAIEAEGLASRGAFHVAADDAVPPFADGVCAATLVLVGNMGPGMWAAFSVSKEAADGAPDALDRWSRRVVSLVFDSREIKSIVNQQFSRRKKSLSLHTGA